jgi:hypothetical protein
MSYLKIINGKYDETSNPWLRKKNTEIQLFFQQKPDNQTQQKGRQQISLYIIPLLLFLMSKLLILKIHFLSHIIKHLVYIQL